MLSRVERVGERGMSMRRPLQSSASTQQGDEVPLSPMKSPISMSSVREEYGKGEGEGDGKDADGVDEKVFDAAEKSIKYLVLTNTWRKWVVEQGKEMRGSTVTLTA